MKNFLFLLAIVAVTQSCQSKGAQSSQKAGEAVIKTSTAAVLTPDELFTTPDAFKDQQVTVRGLCVHTCKHSGKRMFLKGEYEDQLLLITTGKSTSVFDNSLEGSQVVVTGHFSVIPGREPEREHKHQAGEEACETEAKSKNYQVECLTFAKAD